LIFRANEPTTANVLVLIVVVSAFGLFAACDEVSEEACTPLDQPSFSNVYELVVTPSCAVGGSCHGGGSFAGGLDLGALDRAYTNLLERQSVIPGSAAQSPLMSRLDSSVSDPQHMPPGQMLNEAQRCMVATWINDGAAP